jgi:hypothetical protein
MGLALSTLARPAAHTQSISYPPPDLFSSEFLSQRNARNTPVVARRAVHGDGAWQTASSAVMHDDISAKVQIIKIRSGTDDNNQWRMTPPHAKMLRHWTKGQRRMEVPPWMGRWAGAFIAGAWSAHCAARGSEKKESPNRLGIGGLHWVQLGLGLGMGWPIGT